MIHITDRIDLENTVTVCKLQHAARIQRHQNLLNRGVCPVRLKLGVKSTAVRALPGVNPGAHVRHVTCP